MASPSTSPPLLSSSHLLTALPLELLVFVIENLDRVEDIAAFALSNRRIYSAANPFLYRRAAQCEDARALAWAANRGLLTTLRMALAAGADPNYEFVERVPEDEWERVSAAARADAAAGRPKQLWAMWDFGNRPASASSSKWSSHSDVDPADDRHDDDDDDQDSHDSHDHSPEPVDDAEHDTDTDSVATPIATPAASSTAAPSPRPPIGSDQDSVLSSDEDLSRRSDATPATEPEATPTPDSTVTRRYYAVHLAARGGHDDILELLLRHGADVNASAERFCACTPLYGLLNTLEHPDPDAERPIWTPLHAAICHAHPSTAKLLLAHKASPILDTSDPTTDPGLGTTALHHAAAFGLTTLVTHLLDTHTQTDINTPTAHTTTPFYHAYAHRRWSSTIPLLLARGASLECEIKMYIPYTAITPLGEACRLGDFRIADRLLALGADPAHGFVALTATGGCLTPLHMCCMRSAKPAAGQRCVEGATQYADDGVRGRARMRTIRRLIGGGARLDARDCFGSTPLMAAVQSCNTFALEALSLAGVEEEGGAKAKHKDGVGAKPEGELDVVEEVAAASPPPGS